MPYYRDHLKDLTLDAETGTYNPADIQMTMVYTRDTSKDLNIKYYGWLGTENPQEPITGEYPAIVYTLTKTPANNDLVYTEATGINLTTVMNYDTATDSIVGKALGTKITYTRNTTLDNTDLSKATFMIKTGTGQ